MSFYATTLYAHSYLRWAVLAAALLVLARTFRGWRGARAWTRPDERLHAALVGLTDLQFTLGVVLYLFLSPLSHAFFAAPATTIKVAVLRFFGLEHPLMMLLAVSLLHVGRTRSKRAASPVLRHRGVFTTTLIALLMLGASIPWPGLDVGRPLLRGLGSAQPADGSGEHSLRHEDGHQCPSSSWLACHGQRRLDVYVDIR